MFTNQPTHSRLTKSEFVSPANNVLSERSKKKGGLAGEELLAEPIGRRVRVARVLLPARGEARGRPEKGNERYSLSDCLFARGTERSFPA